MKRVKYLLFLFALIPFIKINASGSITVSTSDLNINEGNSKTFTIKANNAAGRVDISSSNTSVATVSKSSVFLDNNSVTITVKGKSTGTANISIKMTDVATYDGDVLSGNKTILVTVKEVKKPTPVKTEPKKMSIERFEIVGYPIDFEVNKQEYTIDVSDKIDKLYIIVEGSNFTATGNKEVSIKDKNEITVSLKDEVETKDYVIKINRISSEVIPNKNDENVKIEYIENDINKILVGVALFFGLLSIVLIVIALKGKNKPKPAPKSEPNYKNNIVDLNPNWSKSPFSEDTSSKPIESNWKDSPFNENRVVKEPEIKPNYNETSLNEIKKPVRKFISDDAFSDIDINEELPSINSVLHENTVNNDNSSQFNNNINY